MKQLIFILTGLSLLFFFGCVDDSADNPTFGENDMPHIYVGWLYTMAYRAGDTIKIEPQVSPSDGATYLWTFDGNTIATTKDLKYKLSDELLGSYKLKFEVTRNGVSNSREATVLLTKEFVPKLNKHKLIGFLSWDASPDDVDWGAITHLVVTSAVVNEDGTLKASFAQLNIPVLLAFAHSHGVYVTLQISGVINYINSGCLYDSRTFYNPATTNPDVLADNIVKIMTDYGFDGVDIYMDKAIDVKYDDPAAIKVFYEKVAEKIKSSTHTIDGKEYDYLLSMSVVGGWTKTSLGGVVNLPQYDWVNVLAFLDEDIVGVPRSHGTVAYASTEISNWLNWLDCGPVTDPSRLVLIAPDAGIRYYGIPSTFTWPTWDNFAQYINYRDLCSTYTNLDVPVPLRNPARIVITDNYNNPNLYVDMIYYNGLRDMQRRVDVVVIPNNLGGIGLWSLSGDTHDPATSLLTALKETLDNYE